MEPARAYSPHTAQGSETRSRRSTLLPLFPRHSHRRPAPHGEPPFRLTRSATTPLAAARSLHRPLGTADRSGTR